MAQKENQNATTAPVDEPASDEALWGKLQRDIEIYRLQHPNKGVTTTPEDLPYPECKGLCNEYKPTDPDSDRNPAELGNLSSQNNLPLNFIRKDVQIS